jgi:hypothetical protein
LFYKLQPSPQYANYSNGLLHVHYRFDSQSGEVLAPNKGRQATRETARRDLTTALFWEIANATVAMD